MATESALTLTANDISASEQAELNRWFDSMAQNAPEGVQMIEVKMCPICGGSGKNPDDLRNSLTCWRCDGNGRIQAQTTIDTAASEPEPNAATGWITKTEAEARAEMEAGWQQVEAERKTQLDTLQSDILGKRINRIEAIKRYRVIAGEPSIETALEVVKQMETGRLMWEQQHDEIERQQAEIERLQAELAQMKAEHGELKRRYDGAVALAGDNAERESRAMDMLCKEQRDNDALRDELEAVQAELKRVNAERDRDLAAHIDRVSALAGERDAIKADIAVVLCDLEAISTGMTGDYTPAGIADIAISRLAIYG